MDRRSFIKSGMAGAATAVLASSSISPLVSCTAAKGGKSSSPALNLSFQEGVAPCNTLNEMFDYMEAHGVTGYEPWGGGLPARVNEITQALQGRNIKVSAICAGFQGFILSEDAENKALFDSTMRDIIAAAGELGSTGVIMVPAFNHQSPCKPHTRQTREYLCEQMHELGEYALKHGTTVILEPLNRNEAHYLRQVADAAAICRDSQSAGVKCMGDFWHMQEETSDYAAFLAAGEYLQHVHIASRGDRKMPGEDGEKDNYIEGFRALKQMGYDKYVSFECGCRGDRTICVPAALELLRNQWEQA